MGKICSCNQTSIRENGWQSQKLYSCSCNTHSRWSPIWHPYCHLKKVGIFCKKKIIYFVKKLRTKKRALKTHHMKLNWTFLEVFAKVRTFNIFTFFSQRHQFCVKTTNFHFESSQFHEFFVKSITFLSFFSPLFYNSTNFSWKQRTFFAAGKFTNFPWKQ